MSLRGINHIVLKVRRLEVADQFYRGILGLERIGERPGMWFYRAGGHHHDLALVEVGPTATRPPHSAVGLFHFCLDVSDEKSLAELYQRCQQAGARILGTVDHTIMRSFYVQDPDGNVVELGVDVPPEEWMDLADPLAQDRPYLIQEDSEE